MVQLQTLNASPAAHLQKMGWDWLLGKDTMPYLTSEVVVVRKKEAEAYWQAAEELYQMLVKAGQHVMDHQLWDQLGIPENLRELIGPAGRMTGTCICMAKLDLSGGVEGQPIKFIEFNADTATCLPETAVVQWAQLKANGMDEKAQFNTLLRP